MSIFWIVVALFLIGALLMLLPPLWRPRPAGESATLASVNLAVYRDQLREAESDVGAGLIAPQHLAQARTDIQRRLLEDAAPDTGAATPRAARRSAIALAVVIPLGAVLSYLALGDLKSLAPTAAPAAAAPADGRHSITPEQIQAMVANLAERLKADPNNAEGWAMLGRSYTTLARYRDAATALRRANELAPGNPNLLADLADVLALLQGKRLAGEPAGLVQQALDADPRHPKALALAGSVAFEARDYAAARGYWERLIALVPAGSPVANSVQGSIAQARQLEQASAPAPIATANAANTVATTAAAVAPSLAGEVSISPELTARIAPGDTLFVFARAAQGPRMPLAIVKRPVGTWPSAFVLDDSMAMAANLRLSAFEQVVVGARISRSGNATPQPGDLVGQSAVVAHGAKGLHIVIDRVQP